MGINNKKMTKYFWMRRQLSEITFIKDTYNIKYKKELFNNEYDGKYYTHYYSVFYRDIFIGNIYGNISGNQIERLLKNKLRITCKLIKKQESIKKRKNYFSL